MNHVVQAALDAGFTHAAPMDPATLVVRDEVRAMCAADLCRAYGRNWMCPPAVGTLDAARRTLARYRTGLLVQTTGDLEDPFDYDTMTALGEAQELRLLTFRKALRPGHLGMLTLGHGACTLCPECTYPSAPCRKPAQAMPSMEAFGLVVSDVCTANGLGYYYGPNTLTYTGCYLFE